MEYTMNGTEQVAEALRMRGLFVEVQDDWVVLTESNTAGDMDRLWRLLQAVALPAWRNGKKLQVLVNQVPAATLRRIRNAPGREFPVSMQPHHFRWRAFAQRRFGIQVNALELDANMAMLVKSLNLAGITALAGCNGHNRYAPNVQLSGVFQGAWLQVMQRKYLQSCRLHYTWKVAFGGGSGSYLTADKAEGERWSMEHLYADTVEMARVLQAHAAELRALKKQAFKRSGAMKEQAEQLAREERYAELVTWMAAQV